MLFATQHSLFDIAAQGKGKYDRIPDYRASVHSVDRLNKSQYQFRTQATGPVDTVPPNHGLKCFWMLSGASTSFLGPPHTSQ